MITVEVRGIECSVYDEHMDDFETLELLARLSEGDLTALVGFARVIFGAEQLENIKDALRDEKGIAKVTDVNAFVNEAVTAAAAAKKADAKN